MNVMFDGRVNVHYGYINLAIPEQIVDLADARRGQYNGLVGASTPGCLAMVTGLHTGAVHLRVEWHPAAPPLDPAWEEVVEASLNVTAPAVQLAAFEDFHDLVLPALGPHRVRYHAIGMDDGNMLDTTEGDELAPDRYLLQLWPAAPEHDQILRQTSVIAGYWHGTAAAS